MQLSLRIAITKQNNSMKNNCEIQCTCARGYVCKFVALEALFSIVRATMDNCKQRKPRQNYTQVEDTLLLQAVQTCGREWKSVLSFMRRHVEVLGEAGDQYLAEGHSSNKALQERLRKRATKLLNNALHTR